MMKFKPGDLVAASKKGYIIGNPLGVIISTDEKDGLAFVLWTTPTDWTGDRCYWCDAKSLEKVP
mgnify:FL=1